MTVKFVGNRISRSVDDGSTITTNTSSYPLSSYCMQSITLGAGGTHTPTHDAADNVTYDNRTGGGYGYSYTAAGRLSCFSINGVVQAEYEYNAPGQQVVRRLTQTGQAIHSLYDLEGHRIAEYDFDASTNTSTLIREYFWIGDEVVAVIENGQLYNVRTDHIGRPSFATDGTGTIASSLSYKPFGEVVSATGLDTGLRFPGQVFQFEASLHQNWMRDYDPTLGRYIRADPLGLVDGASVYGYALQNPGRYTDPRGEFAWGLVFAGAALFYEVYQKDWRWECVNWFNVGLAGVGGGVLGAWKLGAFTFKRGGSHTWGATRKWMNRRGIQLYTELRNQRSHWLFEQNQGIGKRIPDWTKNQP